MPLKTNTVTLPPKLAAVLVRLVETGKLNKTQAVKLPYLVDVVARHVLGRPITEGHHQAWDHGVVTREAWRYLDRCDEASLFTLEPVPWSEEKRVRVNKRGEFAASQLTADEERIVDSVIAEFAATPAGDLGRMTKRMNPQIKSWGRNGEADIGDDAYDRMSPEYQEMAEAAAAWTLDRLRRESKPVVDLEEAIA
jgi:uncharacterized phage-associated protein